MKLAEPVTFHSYKDCLGYVINLDRERWRYDEAAKKLTQIGFSNLLRWQATDYKNYDVNTEVKRMGAKRLERFVNDAEIALVLSHWKVWAHFLASGEQYCLVFEDDVVGVQEFSDVADFNDLRYGDFDVLAFGGVFLDMTDTAGNRKFLNLSEAQASQRNRSYLQDCSFWQSHAYLISREGAYKALLGYPSWMSLEEYRQPQVDNYIANDRNLRTMLASNRNIGDVGEYSLSGVIHHTYGNLSDRLCGILLQEKNYKSTIQQH